MSFIKITVRNIPRRRLRNVLTIMAIVLSIALFVGINVATDSAWEAFERYVDKVWGETDIVVWRPARETFGEENLSLVKEVGGIDRALARLELAAFIDGDRGKLIGVSGVDLEMDYEYEGYRDLVSGDWNISGNNVVVTRSLSDTYDLGIGDTLTITLERGIEENGKLHSLKIIGIFKPPKVVEFPNYFFIELGYLQSITGKEGKVNSIRAKVIDVGKTAEIGRELENTLGAEFVIRTPKLDAIERIEGKGEGFEHGLHGMVIVSLIVCAFLVFNTMFITVKERTHEIGILRSTGASGFQIFRMFLGESLLLGAVGISFGMIGGLALSKFFIWLFTVSFPGFPEVAPFVLTPAVLQMSIVAGLITVLAGALYPAISACRVTVDQALRPGMRFGRRNVPMSVYFGVGLTLFTFGGMQHMGMLPFRIEAIDSLTLLVGAIIITGVVLSKVSASISKYLARISRGTGMLVSRNLGRKILRNAVCFGIIGISLSFIIMMGGIKCGVVEAMELAVRESFGCDIILRSPGLNLPTAFTDNLMALDGVKMATPMSAVPGGTKCLSPVDKSIGVMVVDPETYPDVIHYDFLAPSSDEAYRKLTESTEALILPKVLADELGVWVGDNLTLLTWTVIGHERRSDNTDFTVAGIFVGGALRFVELPGGHLMSESVVISFDSEAKHFYPVWGENRAWVFYVNVEPGAEPEEALKTIDDAFPLYRFAGGSVTLNEILGMVRTDIDRVFFILFSVLYFSVFIAVMAVAIVMIMNVTERKREIGILRSQGISGRQTSSMILGEAIVMGLIGFAIGLLCGTIILHGVTTTMLIAGFNIRMILPWDTIVHALILSIVVAIGGGLYPARRASKLTVVETLQQK